MLIVQGCYGKGKSSFLWMYQLLIVKLIYFGHLNLRGVVGMVLGSGVEGHEFESCMDSGFFFS